MTFKEISTGLSVVVLIGVYGYYFAHVGAHEAGGTIGFLSKTVLLVVVLEVALHAALAICHRPERPDERDRLISAKGFRNAYFVMVAGALCAIVQVLAPEVLRGVPFIGGLPPEIAAAHVLVLTLIGATLFNDVSVLAYYRVGV